MIGVVVFSLLGDEALQRVPANADTILTSFEAARPMQHPLTAHI